MAGGRRFGMNTGYQTHHCKQGNHGRTTVTDKRQGQTDNRGNTDTHTNITDHLEAKSRGNTKTNQSAHIVRAVDTYPQTPGNNGNQQEQRHQPLKL